MTVVITDTDEVPRFAPTPDMLQGEVETNAQEAGDAVWEPQKSTSGPVSIIVSASDHRLVVLRNGLLIGSAPITIDGALGETSAYSLAKVDSQGFHWMKLLLPGQKGVGGGELPASDRTRLKIPEMFRMSLDNILSPGVTMIVTEDSLISSATGKNVTLIISTP